jgi:N4-(beta-N-acetylglucosaminyl)-L-asparaginase
MSSTTKPYPAGYPAPSRRELAGLAAGLAAACSTVREVRAGSSSGRKPVMVGSENALPGMRAQLDGLVAGGAPLDAAIEVCKVAEADPSDTSVGLGGMPNEDGVVQLDAAVMFGPTHKSGAVACIENILHPSEVARLVMERTDHCLLVGAGAYAFARAHGFPHVDLLTESSRKQWLDWKERLSAEDDWLAPRGPKPGGKKSSRADAGAPELLAAGEKWHRPTGTIHCSALSVRGEVACCTSTSGLAFKIPGRVGDSPIIGAGLYCDQEAGSAGATGRGEASILSCGSFALVELMRQGASPLDAGREVLRRIVRQVQRLAQWQPELLGPDGKPSFNIQFYALDLQGRWTGVALKSGKFAVADPERGPRQAECVPLDG